MVANTGRHNQQVHTSVDATADERKTEKLPRLSKIGHTLNSSEEHLHAAIWFKCSHCNTILADHALHTFKVSSIGHLIVMFYGLFKQ